MELRRLKGLKISCKIYNSSVLASCSLEHDVFKNEVLFSFILGHSGTFEVQKWQVLTSDFVF